MSHQQPTEGHIRRHHATQSNLQMRGRFQRTCGFGQPYFDAPIWFASEKDKVIRGRIHHCALAGHRQNHAPHFQDGVFDGSRLGSNGDSHAECKFDVFRTLHALIEPGIAQIFH
ncbi:MAG: hypothetical protein GY820_47900 [Gammaproteobacteria bacterium]|nr:hypothetical protein [Gammaproteobacteria bacterium]